VCVSAETSLWVAVALLPVGGYAVAAADVKDRAYLPLATFPFVFGVQQVFGAGVWAGVDRGDPGLAQAATAGFLLLALVVWPIGVPLAAAALEEPGRRRATCFGFAAAGLATACVYGLPVVAGGRAAPAVVGHALRFDLPDPGPVCLAFYLAAVCVPLAGSRVPRVRPLGWLAVAAAVVAFLAAPEAFASAWACLVAVASGYVAFVLYAVPDPRPGTPGAAGHAL
jgi:hypothetical protein